MSQYAKFPAPAAGGAVSSVGLSAPASILSVSGSPITTAGTLALSLATQSANLVWAGPTSGLAATPTFRSLVAADIPTLTSSKISDFTSSTQSVAASNTSTRVMYVSDDSGNDSNDGSLLKPFKTIQAALNAAAAFPSTFNTPVLVKVYPSTSGSVYTENLTISQQGVMLEAVSNAYHSDMCTIHGSITVNLTGIAGGGSFAASQNNAHIQGFAIVSSAASPTIVFSGTVYQGLFLEKCTVQNTGGSNALSVTNSGTSGGAFSTVTIRDCDFSNSSASNATISHTAGNVFNAGANPSITNSTAGGPAIAFSGHSNTINNGSVTGVVTNSSTGTLTLTNTTVTAATSSALITLSAAGSVTLGAASLTNSTSTGSGIIQSNAGGTVTVVESLFNVGTGTGAYVAKGTGVFVYALNAFVSNKNLQNTLTIVPLASTPTTGP